MTRGRMIRSLGLVALAVSCGGSPEPPAKAPEKTAPAGEKAAPALPELDVMKVASALRGNEAAFAKTRSRIAVIRIV